MILIPGKYYYRNSTSLSKYLSKHSIGAYRELYRGVGISFKAILVPESSNAAEKKVFKDRRGAKVYVLSIA